MTIPSLRTRGTQTKNNELSRDKPVKSHTRQIFTGDVWSLTIGSLSNTQSTPKEAETCRTTCGE